MDRLIGRIRNTSLFAKLFLAFVLLLAMPIAISYQVSQRETSQVIVRRVQEETLNSLEIVGNRIDDVLVRMIHAALYLNNDTGVQAMLLEGGPPQPSGSARDNLELWTRLDAIGRMFENLAFNVMRTKCYFTLTSPTGLVYTSWTAMGTDVHSHLSSYRASESEQGMFVSWVGLEANYVRSDAPLYPHVITLTKTLSDRQGNARYGLLVVSIPETEIRALLSRPGDARTWYVVDRARTVLSATDPLAVGTTLPPVAVPGEGAQGSFLSTAEDRARLLVSYRTIRNDEWTVVTVEPYESIIRELNSIRWKLVWVNVLSALAFVAVAALIARSITRPIRVLADNMRNLESELTRSGEPRAARFDEIGALERSYDAMRRRLGRLMRQIEDKEKKKREAELEALQLQVSPHFLFNTLSSIRWAILNRNNTKAAGMIFALGNLLRMSLLKTNEFITVDQELENLAHYLDIVRLRRAVSFEVRYTVEAGVRQELIPRLILQPLVENAVIHGLDPDRTDGHLEIVAGRDGNRLHFAVRDNGRGTPAEPRPRRARGATGAKLSGIGLRNVRERIKLIYGSGYILRRSGTAGKGTTVTFHLPILSRRPPA